MQPVITNIYNIYNFIIIINYKHYKIVLNIINIINNYKMKSSRYAAISESTLEGLKFSTPSKVT